MDKSWDPVLEDLRTRFTSETDVVEVEAYLFSQGYDNGQVGEILELLFSGVATEVPELAGMLEARPMPIRVQGPHERGRFSAEAWGYLIMLGGSGLVSQHDFEQLVERALMHVDGRIGLPEIRAIADDGGFDEAATLSDRSQVH
ncbi:MAG: DUF494 family protein [Gemmatimonadaceae bacterium]